MYFSSPRSPLNIHATTTLVIEIPPVSSPVIKCITVTSYQVTIIVRRCLLSSLLVARLFTIRAYIGRRIERHKDLFYIDQRHYLETILERFGLENCKPALTPMEEKLKLAPRSSPDSDNTVDPDPAHDINEYRRAIGSLIAAGPT